MKMFKRDYDFYQLPEDERKALIGSCFKVEGFEHLYYPIGLFEDFNYGIDQGVIFVSPIMKYNSEKWFRVGVFSPDDLDMDLDFNASETHKRQEIISHLNKIKKIDVTYRGVLEEIQKLFGGKLT